MQANNDIASTTVELTTLIESTTLADLLRGFHLAFVIAHDPTRPPLTRAWALDWVKQYEAALQRLA